ncbi:MAG: hypothetical protein AAFV86_20910, partial [Pseudomonadota bacterium]
MAAGEGTGGGPAATVSAAGGPARGPSRPEPASAPPGTGIAPPPGTGIAPPPRTGIAHLAGTGIAHLAGRVRAGERRALARAITLVESTNPAHRADAAALLAAVAPAAGRARRIGLSGTPG